MKATARLRAALGACTSTTKVFLRDVGAGLLDVSHNTLALVGFCVVGAAFFASTHDQLRASVEGQALDWLRDRQEARAPAKLVPDERDAVDRATALDPRSLPRQQAAVANWISLRYKVAPEPIGRLVQEAWQIGKSAGLDPALILAVMAVESSFNPFAQSPVGAQGLMQVMTRIHDDKYEAYGGIRAAFDPVSNLRVGVLVLVECIKRAGGVEAGLKYYVGAANTGLDGGYAAKVLAMQGFLRSVADGKRVAANAPLPTPPSVPAATSIEKAASLPAAERLASGVQRVAMLD